MKRKLYCIKLWVNERSFCKWNIYAKDNVEAQSICEYLKQCCVMNGRWKPVRADIKVL